LTHEEVCGFFTAIQEKTGFKIITNHFILFGICADCQKLEGP
jgi:Fe2+ or Zn2+ uptake regulation protein